jgi:hypothetical protein
MLLSTHGAEGNHLPLLFRELHTAGNRGFIRALQDYGMALYAKIKNMAVSIKNEVMEMIAKVRERKGRLDLPIHPLHKLRLCNGDFALAGS